MLPLIEELTKRGLISQTSGNLNELLSKPTTFYIGLDPTSDSLGVHHLVGLMTAKILQKYGHKPIILVGGATCAIGDPSGKSQERNTISMEDVFNNVEKVKKQISSIINFDDSAENGAIMLNNYDWYNGFQVLDFLRLIGKKITVNYLMAKENVRKRLERDGSGISFQEFSYGLLQGYDFVHLYQNYNCKLQIGGTDNLGNIITGIDLVHKMIGQDDACGLTWDLITCADGKKFGKTEGNSVWLDAKKTTPYDFMQFWLNQSDEDAEVFIKKFTLLELDEIDRLIELHRQNPSKRLLQKRLAEEVTCMIHGREAFRLAVSTANVMFGNPSKETLTSIKAEDFEKVFEGLPTFNISKDAFVNGEKLVDVSVSCGAFSSKNEARTMIKSNAISINREKVYDVNKSISVDDLIHGKYMTIQKGKKVNILVIAQ